MSALTWIPDIFVLTWAQAIKPPELDKIREKYIPRRNRTEGQGWFWKNIPTSLQIYVDKTMRSQTVTRLGARGVSRTKGSLYQGLSPRHKRSHEYNRSRRLAKRMRLILITCLVGTNAHKTVAFDSDSHTIAIDNCASRSMTTSSKDFLPGTTTQCNISVAGVGGNCSMSTYGNRLMED